jgi:flagellar motor protein MotB
MEDYELHVQDSDELGPGSDLVISMFALAMLVVALVGFGLGTEGSNYSPSRSNTDLSSNDSGLMTERDAALAGKRQAEMVAAAARDDLHAKDKVVAAQDLALKAIRNDLNERNARLVAARNRLEVVEDTNSRLEETNIRLGARVQELTAKLEAIRRPENSILTLRDNAGSSFFPNGSAEISPDGRRMLLIAVKDKANLIRSGQFNTIVIEGYTSPDPRWTTYGFDTNEELAFDRAATVERILVQAGVPRRCLALMSYGRNRSDLLYGPSGAKPMGTESDTMEFDKAYHGGRISLREDRLASERRIEVRALLDPQYKLCSPSELSQRLGDVQLP